MLRCQDFQDSVETQTSVRHYLKLRPTQSVYCLKTEGGGTIKAKADHPFWTPKGMTELQSLKMALLYHHFKVCLMRNRRMKLSSI